MPLTRPSQVVTKPDQLVHLRRRIERKYGGGKVGDDPEPLTDYEDVSDKLNEFITEELISEKVFVHDIISSKGAKKLLTHIIFCMVLYIC